MMAMERARNSLQVLSDAAMGSATVEEGLERCLPLVDSAFPADHVVAYLRNTEQPQFRLVVAWPEQDEEDSDRPFEPAFSQATATHKSIFDESWCYVPVGKTLAGELVLAIHKRDCGEARSLFSPAMAEAVAASFMRLAGQVENLSELKGLTRIDPLTGLGNRRVLGERSETEMGHAERTGRAMCVAMIDIDHFKEYNDSYGHLAGDALLFAIAKGISGMLRSQDCVVRYGGEEFCVILPETDLQTAEQLIDDLRLLVHDVGGRRPVSVSAGVAEWDGSEDFEDLLRRADVALYEAKEQGRDRVCRYHTPVEV
jgi:diguanylate cyclase (GGDEF)-like protein